MKSVLYNTGISYFYIITVYTFEIVSESVKFLMSFTVYVALVESKFIIVMPSMFYVWFKVLMLQTRDKQSL